MSRRQLRTDDEEGFLRAFRDEVFDLAEYHKVRLEFHLALPVRGPGVVIRGFAFRKAPDGSEQVYATCEQPYPTHAATRLHAALYRAAIRMGGAVLERVRADREQLAQSTST